MKYHNISDESLAEFKKISDEKGIKYESDSTLSWKSGLHIQTIRKLIRQGKIKARQIPKGPFLILRKDNPDLLKVIQELA
jgi:hypothetical protein